MERLETDPAFGARWTQLLTRGCKAADKRMRGFLLCMDRPGSRRWYSKASRAMKTPFPVPNDEDLVHMVHALRFRDTDAVCAWLHGTGPALSWLDSDETPFTEEQPQEREPGPRGPGGGGTLKFPVLAGDDDVPQKLGYLIHFADLARIKAKAGAVKECTALVDDMAVVVDGIRSTLRARGLTVKAVDSYALASLASTAVVKFRAGELRQNAGGSDIPFGKASLSRRAI